MRRLLAAFGVLWAIGASSAGAEPSKPLLAFSSTRGGDGFTFYTVRTDGRDRRNLGASWEYVYWVAAAFSPDGRRVALTGPEEYAVAAADGSGRRSLPGGGSSEGSSSISWSPDGRRIAIDGAVLDVETGREALGVPGEVPSFSHDGKLLAFTARNALWLMPATGGPRRYVGPAVGNTERHVASLPSWSPDSRRLAYEFGGDVLVYDVASRKRRHLTRTARSETEPTWSPDGRWIAFVRGAPHSGRDVRTGVSVIHPDGTGLRVLTDIEFTESSPTWSPDSRRLAFLANPDEEDGAERAYVVSLATRRLHRIISPICGRPERFAALSWGRGRFVFASALPRFEEVSDDLELYSARTDATGARRLGGSCEDEYAPAWSPDGTELAYSRGRDLRVRRVDGSRDRRLAAGGLPDWSPDGRTIVFSRPEDQVYAIATTGGDARRLTTLGKNTGPAWSSAAGRIAFTSRRDGRAEIYTMLPDGSDQRRVTQLGGADPSWSPDGKRIAYIYEHGVWTISPDGSDPHNLVTTYSEFDTVDDPEWSPDGSTIAVAAYDDYWTVGSLLFLSATGGGSSWMSYNPFVGSTGTAGYAWPDWYPR